MGAKPYTDDAKEYGHCHNCGVPLCGYGAIDREEAHPIQLRHENSDGVWCEACAFKAPCYGEYEHDGMAIVTEAED